MSKRVLPLSELQVSRAKPKDKAYKLYDGFGLALLVSPTGGKLWRLRYHHRKKAYDMALGAYPDLSLTLARKKRDEIRQALANGTNPLEESREAARKGMLFEALALEWYQRFFNKWAETTRTKLLARLKRDIFPFLGERPASEITPPELLDVLRRIELRSIETAHRMKIACGQIFRYGVATGRVERDPAADLKGALSPIIHEHMAAPTEPAAVGGLLRAIDGFSGTTIVRAALQLTPMLFLRPGELRGGEWKELDLDNAIWNIPKERMKSRKPHTVPLPRQAVEIFRSLQPLTGHGKLIFPAQHTSLRSMSENTVNSAFRRMGFGQDEVCGHGLRATARTMLHERLKFAPEVIEAQLAHAVPDKLGRAYNRTHHLQERTRMMQVWADYLDFLKRS